MNRTGEFRGRDVVAFLEDHTIYGPGRKRINGVRTTDTIDRSINRWKVYNTTVTLEALDNLLVHCGLMLWEFEEWLKERDVERERDNRKFGEEEAA